jgi:hypothetical protein
MGRHELLEEVPVAWVKALWLLSVMSFLAIP